MDPNEDTQPCACANCDWTGPRNALAFPSHLFERVEPGEAMPAGECPECGALAHATEPISDADRIGHARTYSAALNVLEIPPNGDDFNAILDLLNGAPYRPPHETGR